VWNHPALTAGWIALVTVRLAVPEISSLAAVTVAVPGVVSAVTVVIVVSDSSALQATSSRAQVHSAPAKGRVRCIRDS